MKSILRLFILFIIVSFATSANAQFQGPVYQYDTSVKVFAYGSGRTLAWCGGFNSAQYAMADLNNDGKQDLVVFDSWEGIRTFINNGTPGNPQYTYAPEYELNFPPVTDYVIMADYNCDNISDLFTQQSTDGFVVYKGHYNSSNELCFTYYKALFYTDTSSPALLVRITTPEIFRLS